MKLLFYVVIFAVAAFSVNKYYLSGKIDSEALTVADVIVSYPVNIFDFKQTMADYAHHLCYKNEDVLSYQDISARECVNNHDDRKPDCESRIFRLAPLNLKTKEEVIDYSKQYTQCTLPYKYIMG
ncbi:hypothetical protein [Pseudoalteromonas aliena]|uniref:hypothetical protein n=1 Tax=Pseudoalteromonas aliena TaxID=247523 RepID=UPI001865FC13|nr:hypothetical protein [Pseudoalteromonas aliena]